MTYRPGSRFSGRPAGFFKILRVFVLLWLCAGEAPAAAADWPAPLAMARPLSVTQAADGVHLDWTGSVFADPAGAPTLPDWPIVTLGEARLPAQLIAVRFTGDPPTPRLTQTASLPWSGDAPAAPTIVPQTLTGERRPDLAQAQSVRLPAGPVSLLRVGRLRGIRIAVFAVSPFFERAGQAQVTTELHAVIPGAQIADLGALAGALTTRPFLAEAPGPTNPAALKPAIKLRVTQPGIQEVSGAALAAAGATPPWIPATFQVWHAGQRIAAELRDDGDGSFDPQDTLRFFAAPPGDRWNAADTYWLTVETQPGVRMASRPALTDADATVTTMGTHEGAWRANRLYDTTLPGPDGDHWFAAELRSGPELPAATFTVPLASSLPLAAGPMTLTLAGSAYTAGNHVLTLNSGAYSTTRTWNGSGEWSHTVVFPAALDALQLMLLPGVMLDGILLDSLRWLAPVRLVTGGEGAFFSMPAGAWRTVISDIQPSQALYDISAPDAPIRVDFAGAAPGIFESGPAAARYLLTGPGTLHAPVLSLHTPVKLTAPLDADVVYLAPSAFLHELAPLVAHRQTQGYAVAVVDVQTIYDAWSGGQVAPDAIRDFLRYAAATWSRPPVAAVLVGDGTSDPLNFTGRNNTNFLPPYLAMVDPWLGETACDTCYGQLDGVSPLDDPLPDVWIGRLPVKSAAELVALVDKLIGYETAPPDAGPVWRTRNVYITDNYRNPDGSTDPAGDFGAFADLSVALQPPWIEVERMYYDPGPTPPGDPWREPDAATAHQHTLALLSAGAGLANYVGHSHHWQWAVTDLTASPPYLLGMYEVDGLGNRGRLPILLEMTCLTSAFQQPAFSGTTIDERFILQRGGGAVAVWGPTGLGLMHGHDALQRGFYAALWQAPPGAALLGALTTAGYLELFSHGNDQDTLRTFLLLGDPLTPARIFVSQHLYLPLVLK